MAKAWRAARQEYRKHFNEHNGLQDLFEVKRNCPKGVQQSDWEYMCEQFADPAYLVFFSFILSLIINFLNTFLLLLLLLTFFYRQSATKMLKIEKSASGTRRMGQFLMLVIMFVLVRI